MSGDTDPKWNEDASPSADAPAEGDSEEETKVVLDDLNPPAKTEKDTKPEKPTPAKTETAPSVVPGVARMKKASEARAESGRGGAGGVLSGAALLLWSGSKFLCRVALDFVKLTLWRVPRHAYRSWRGIPSKKVRRGVALGVGLLIGVGIGLFYFLTSPVTAGSGKETCEFLARPAAKVYIDGQLAAEEVPPIHRVRLDVGKHRVRFVSPENRAHEAEIEVVHGAPTQWFMNFVDNQIRSLIPETESK